MPNSNTIEQISGEEVTGRRHIIEGLLTQEATDREQEEKIWKTIAEVKGLPMHDYEIDIAELIRYRGPVRVDRFMGGALYGTHGYYTERAVINQIGSGAEGSFVTVVGNPNSVAAFNLGMDKLYDGDNRGIKQVLSIGSGEGDFELNTRQLAENSKIPGRSIYTIDLSHRHARNIGTMDVPSNTPIRSIQGDGFNIPVRSETFDYIFGNEVQDAIPPLAFEWNSKSKSFYTYYIGHDDRKGFYTLKRKPTELEQKALNLYQAYTREADIDIRTLPQVVVGLGNIRLIREVSRILRVGGVAMFPDYTVVDKGRSYNYITFQGERSGSWNNQLLDEIEKYKPPYLDITQQMDVGWITYIARAYGLEAVYSETQHNFEKEFGPEELTVTSAPDHFSDNFRVLAFRKGK